MPSAICATSTLTADGAVEQDFPGQAPFPDDVRTAPLVRLSLAKLLAESSSSSSTNGSTSTASGPLASAASATTEQARLFSACRELGGFHLDLRGAEGAIDETAIKGDAYMELAHGLVSAGHEMFSLPLADKQHCRATVVLWLQGHGGPGLSQITNNLDCSMRYDCVVFFSAFQREA